MRMSDYLSPEELRRLLASLALFLVVLSVFLLFGFIVVPGLRNANRPPVAAPVEATSLETGWLDPTEYPPAPGYDIPPLDPQAVLKPTPELLQRGGELYAKDCVQCHGKEGRGDGTAAGSLKPPPRNFTVAEGWKNGNDRPAIYKTLTDGIPGSSMASFSSLRPWDRMALVHYVQSLGKFPRAPEQPLALDAFSKLLAKPGERVPNKIPVSQAIARLVEEAPPTAPIPMPPAGEVGLGPAILRRVVADPARAAETLALSPSWRDGLDRLARIITSDAPTNGFRVGAATLSPEEWHALAKELITRLPR